LAGENPKQKAGEVASKLGGHTEKEKKNRGRTCSPKGKEGGGKRKKGVASLEKGKEGGGKKERGKPAKSFLR